MSSPDGEPATSVGVVGLGYVGLPLAIAFAEEGIDVVGVDYEARLVASIEAGESHIEDISSERLQAVAERISATTDYARLADCDAVLIAVPTPLVVDFRGVTRHIEAPNRFSLAWS